jgi:DNA-binding transcriptional LysR family regulator
MDMLRAMQVFVEVANKGGFAPAAKSVGLSTSAVSRHIGNLEDMLGTQLFNRTTRHLSLTPTGETLLGQCRRVVHDVDHLIQTARQEPEKPSGRLRVTMTAFVGAIVMEAVVARFALEYPDVELDLLLVDRVVNLVDEGYDLAIRVGEMPDSSLIARKFLDLRLALIASPGYIEKHGCPMVPDDLRDHLCVIDTAAPYRDRWPFRVDGEQRRVHVKSNIIVNVGAAARDLVIGGAGLALLPEYLCHEDILNGRLITVLDEYVIDFGGIFIVYPRSRYPSSAVRRFADLLIEHANPIRAHRERQIAAAATRTRA